MYIITDNACQCILIVIINSLKILSFCLLTARGFLHALNCILCVELHAVRAAVVDDEVYVGVDVFNHQIHQLCSPQ